MGSNNILYVITLILAAQSSLGARDLTLTSEPSAVSGSFCGGPVVFICKGTEIAIVFEWQLNNSNIVQYTFNDIHTFPLSVPVDSISYPGVEIQIVDATLNGSLIDICSTLTVNDISLLNGSSLHCVDATGNPNRTIDILVEPLVPLDPPTPSCTISTQPGSLNNTLALQWSPSFNSQYSVDRYNVTVTPDPSSCSSDQVPPGEDYSCSGLELQTDYSITFSAINCADQEGEPVRFRSFNLQAPKGPTGIEVYIEQDSIRVKWEEVADAVVSENCTFDSNITYTVILEDNSGRVVLELTVISDSCSNGLCSINFSTSAQYCRVGVRASNVIGNSTTEYLNIAPRLTLSNTVLLGLGLGVTFLVVAAIVVVIFIVIILMTTKACVKILLCGCFLLTLVPVVLWVAVGFHVGLQDNTCDAAWQNTRDNLIISAFVIFFLAVITAVIAILAHTLFMIRKKKTRKRIPISSTHDRELIQTFRGRHQGATEARFEWEEDQRSKKQETTAGKNKSQYSTTKHLKPAGVMTPPASTDYSQLGGGTNSVYSGLNHGPGSRQPTGQGEIYDTLAKICCNTMLKRAKFIKALHGETTPEHMAAWLTHARRWPSDHLSKDIKLKVFFMNECPTHWKCRGTEELMEFIQESWTNCFAPGDKDSQIRIKFEDTDFSNWTVLGFPSVHLKNKEKPTMSLNFRSMNEQEIKAMVIHQFGHALGLGHSLMRPEEWEDIKEYVDIQKMAMESHGQYSEDIFEREWTGKGMEGEVEVNYDEKSVMQYSSSSSWLKNVSPDPIPEVVKKFLLLLNTELSDGDKGTLKLMITALAPELLGALKSGKAEFDLTHALSPMWESIGEQLGATGCILEDIRTSGKSDDERLNKVWKVWICTKELHMDIYPPSWDGLRKLLYHIGRKPLADDYFEFMRKY